MFVDLFYYLKAVQYQKTVHHQREHQIHSHLVCSTNIQKINITRIYLIIQLNLLKASTSEILDVVLNAKAFILSDQNY